MAKPKLRVHLFGGPRDGEVNEIGSLDVIGHDGVYAPPLPPGFELRLAILFNVADRLRASNQP